MNQNIVDFYTKNGVTNSGRTFDDIMKFDGDQLEKVHDYIQWLFPTKTPSKIHTDSPTLDDETIELLKSNPEFLRRYQQALGKMLRFWGIPYTPSMSNDVFISNIHLHDIAVPVWCFKKDHNQLRIARVLESTRLLGFRGTSSSLFHALLKFAGEYAHVHEISTRNIAYWYQAMSGIQMFD
jgi:hypothetical protein